LPWSSRASTPDPCVIGPPAICARSIELDGSRHEGADEASGDRKVHLTLVPRSTLVVVVVMMVPTRRGIMMVVVMVSLRELHLACGRIRQTSVVCP
jgi:hypothetical protein